MTSPALMAKTSFFVGPGGPTDPLLLLSSTNTQGSFPLMGDESCSDLSGCSPIATASPQSPPPLMVGGTDIPDVDLRFVELAINSSFGAATLNSEFAGFTTRNFTPFVDESTSPTGREDLSPTSSINSFAGDPNEKKKKGIGRQTDELCLVCGDRASGYHYNALTCEGCKGFFRRSITKMAVYTCKYQKNCEMDMYMRRKCQECRFNKCINVGMRSDCVVPEHACQVKREQKKARDKDKVTITIQDTPKQQLGNGLPSPPSLPNSFRSFGKIELNTEHQELISRLINTQEQCESPPDGSLKCDEDDFNHMTKMTELTIHLIVQFALKMPGFSKFCEEDKLTLLKGSTPELIALRASRRYDPNTNSIVFANNSPRTREYYETLGMKSLYTDSLFNFCERMAKMKVDNAEYALLSAIIICSERPNLLYPVTVESIQTIYVETLYAYVNNKRAPKSGLMMAKMMDVLTQVRSISNMNSEQCEQFLQNDKKLPELLTEIWDIKKES